MRVTEGDGREENIELFGGLPGILLHIRRMIEDREQRAC